MLNTEEKRELVTIPVNDESFHDAIDFLDFLPEDEDGEKEKGARTVFSVIKELLWGLLCLCIFGALCGFFLGCFASGFLAILNLIFNAIVGLFNLIGNFFGWIFGW